MSSGTRSVDRPRLRFRDVAKRHLRQP